MPGASKKEVTDALVSAMVQAGFQVRSVSEYQAEFAKPKGEAFSMVSEVFRGPVYGDIQHEDLLRFTFVDRPGGVYVTGQQFWMERPGSRNPGATVERPSRNEKAIRSLQELLDTMQQGFDSRMRTPATNTNPD